METKEFHIPEQNVQKLRDKFASLAKRAQKINTIPPQLTVGISINETHTDKNGRKYIQRFSKVTVSWDDSASEGWKWIAVLQHLPEGNIIRNVSREELPSQYRNSGPDCDHCNVSRKRINTYILHHQDGKYVQVGRSCLQDFLGSSPSGYAESAAIISDALTASEASEALPVTGGATHLLPLDIFLGYVAGCIRVYGWASKAQVREHGGMATAHRAYTACAAPSDDLQATDEETLEVAAAISWAENLSEDCGEYLHNLKVIAQSSAVEARTIGYAASLLPAYRRHVEESKPKVESNWVGVVGDRKTFNLFIDKVIPIDTAYGENFIHLMKDEAGNIFVWKTKDSLDQGKSYKIAGRIKEHKDRNGVKQTLLSHCKLVE